MKGIIVTTAAAAVCATSAHARELEVFAGFSFLSEYVSQGLRFSDGPAVQPYLEVGFGGAYAGAYLSNVDPDITLANRELGLYLGYRGEVGVFSFDASAYRYLYDEAFEGFPPTDYNEYIFSGTFALSEAVYVTGRIGHAPEFEQNDLSLAIDYYTNVSGLSLAVRGGNVDTNFGDWNYWSLGASYAIDDIVSFDLSYHDTDADPELGLSNTDGLVVATLSFDFSLR